MWIECGNSAIIDLDEVMLLKKTEPRSLFFRFKSTAETSVVFETATIRDEEFIKIKSLLLLLGDAYGK